MTNTVAAAILAATQNAQVRAAMLMGSRLESGQNPQSVGDNGSSFGPFQIHLPAHPGVSSGEAENPQWATNYMLSAYQAGVARVPSTLWATDPAQAAATAAFYAERPAVMYPASRYRSAWTVVKAQLAGQDVGAAGGFTPLGGAAAAGSGLGSGSPTDASLASSVLSVQSWQQNISDVLNYGYMAGIILGGLIAIVVGIVFLMKHGADLVPTVNVKIPPAPKAKTNVTVKPTTPAATGGRTPKPYRNAGTTPQSASRAAGRTAIGTAATGTATRHATVTRLPVRPGRPAPHPVKRVPPKEITA